MILYTPMRLFAMDVERVLVTTIALVILYISGLIVTFPQNHLLLDLFPLLNFTETSVVMKLLQNY